MKRSFIFTFLCCLAVIGIISCEDDVVSKKHVYTPEELEYIDSIEKEKQRIKVDKLIELTVQFPADEAGYTGAEVKFPTAAVMEALGYGSEEELIAAFGVRDGSGQKDNEITFYAIELSTKYENKSGYTANGFGHWFNAAGDVCSWGETARFFCEFYAESLVFNIGQYPGRLKAGEEYRFIQAIQKGSYKIGFDIRITIGEAAPPPEGDNIKTYEITVEADKDDSYSQTPVPVDLEDAAAAFGVSLDELLAGMQLVAINPDEEVKTAFTANAGFYFNNEGYVCSWGAEGCAVFVEFNTETNTFGMGQFPNGCEPGSSYTVALAFMYNEKMVTFKITLNVKEASEIDAHVIGEIDLVLNAEVNNEYTASKLEVDMDAVAAMFGITADELRSNLTICGINPEGDVIVKGFTGNNGYWYDPTGLIRSWGDGCAVYVEWDGTSAFNSGQFPNACQEGDEYLVRIGFMVGEDLVVFNVKIIIGGKAPDVDPEEPPTGDPTDVVESFTIDREYVDYFSDPDVIDVKEYLRDAFKMTTLQIYNAIKEGELVFKGFNEDGSVYVNDNGDPASTAAHPGHWFDAGGFVTTWGNEEAPCMVFSELAAAKDALVLNIGHHPENTVAGDEVTIKQVAELNGGTATFNITIKLK